MKIEATPAELAELTQARRRRRRRRRPEILMASNAYEQCMEILTTHPPEFAGALLGPIGHRAVTHFVPDDTGEGAATHFRLGAAYLNVLLRRFDGMLEAKGFIHSHPNGLGNRRLSRGDLAYVRKLFDNPNNDGDEVLMPIVVGSEMVPFVVRRDDPDTPLAAKLKLF
jgi:hypothetical protein